MRYKVQFKNGKILLFDSKIHFVKVCMPLLKKCENKPKMTRKQKHIVQLALDDKPYYLITNCRLSVQDMAELIGGEVVS